MTFDDPENRLPALDALEGYVPGEEGLYERVLVPRRSRRRACSRGPTGERDHRCLPAGRKLAGGIARVSLY